MVFISLILSFSFLLLYFLVFTNPIGADYGIDRRFCIDGSLPSPSHHAGNRSLLIIVCETRPMRFEGEYIYFWNYTSRHIAKQSGVRMINVCENKSWNGFTTKSLSIVEEIEASCEPYQSHSPHDHHHHEKCSHVLVTDSDTFWAARDLAHIWFNYDCARKETDAIISSEMSCWVGRSCLPDDIEKYYSKAVHRLSYQSSSRSPFVNAGVMMGRADLIRDMLHYITVNNGSYYIYDRWNNPVYFDDQLALTDYVQNVKPGVVTIDSHQLISASCFIAVTNPPKRRGYTCVNDGKGISYTSCSFADIHPFFESRYYTIDAETCFVKRNLTAVTPYREALEGLAETPLLWHGNGESKAACSPLSRSSYDCLISKKVQNRFHISDR